MELVSIGNQYLLEKFNVIGFTNIGKGECVFPYINRHRHHF